MEFILFFSSLPQKETPPTLQRICKPAQANAQTKVLQKSYNLPTHRY
jgi:hypothetical protein